MHVSFLKHQFQRIFLSTKQKKWKIKRLLSKCIRFIFNLRKCEHMCTKRSQLKCLPIRQRCS